MRGTGKLALRSRDPMSDSLASTGHEAAQILLAKQGDAQAFDALVRRHFARVYALLFRMIGNHEDAEDLAQECFIKAQRSLEFYRADASFATWLYRIALHLSRDHFRKRSRRPNSTSLLDGQAPASSRSGPAEQSVAREMTAALRHAMDELPHKLRVALVLRTQEGLEYDEIATLLECNPQTARVHVMKARRRLAGWLESWKDGGLGR